MWYDLNLSSVCDVDCLYQYDYENITKIDE